MQSQKMLLANLLAAEVEVAWAVCVQNPKEGTAMLLLLLLVLVEGLATLVLHALAIQLLGMDICPPSLVLYCMAMLVGEASE